MIFLPKKTATLLAVIVALVVNPFTPVTYAESKENLLLSSRERSLIAIAATCAKGNLPDLKTELNTGLDSGLTVNQVKEALVHVYAYAGFPRSIRGLQTLMMVMDARKARGIDDVSGPEASPVTDEISKYERGKKVLQELTGISETSTGTGYAAFAPVIEVFLKEHLFSDIFERDVLTYKERELLTVSVLSSIGGVEPMLKSHLTICLNIGLSYDQLKQFVDVIQSKVGKKEAAEVRKVLKEIDS